MIRYVAAFFLWCSLFQGHAASLEHLYTVDISVLKKSAESENRLFRKALFLVIQRLLPGHQDMEHPPVSLANAKSLVNHYERHIQGNEYTFHILFDPQKVNDRLKKYDLIPWLTPRPKISAWYCYQLYITKDEPTFFMSKGHIITLPAGIQRSVELAAQEKGLELIYPPATIRADIKDCKMENAKPMYENMFAFKNPNSPPYLQISYVSSVNLYHDYHDDTYFESWSFQYKDIRDRYGSSGYFRKVFADTAGMDIMDIISTKMYEKALAPKRKNVYINIGNIQTADNFHSVRKYLKKIGGVKHVTLNSVTEDTALYTLKIITSIKALKMQLASKYKSMPEKDGILNYRLRS